MELPYISKVALARVKDKLEKPSECRYCGSKVSLINNEKIYGKPFGRWPYVYKCSSCDSYVGTHPGTDIPLGTLANNALRRARVESKTVFIDFYKSRGWGRSKAYRWLSEQIGMPISQCHFGWFDIDMCELAKIICRG